MDGYYLEQSFKLIGLPGQSDPGFFVRLAGSELSHGQPRLYMHVKTISAMIYLCMSLEPFFRFCVSWH